ncbi:hypothetical protein EYF80_010849 [Liparis tanakae]|uniref:Uncharacterized protein n=1 Tax=Liparis tanakae TaxID=230148 RepID=A0A4Z2IP23_9TELE|nr:hypothetical protein EYF80_010849 [Liparis tanakae]
MFPEADILSGGGQSSIVGRIRRPVSIYIMRLELRTSWATGPSRLLTSPTPSRLFSELSVTSGDDMPGLLSSPVCLTVIWFLSWSLRPGRAQIRTDEDTALFSLFPVEHYKRNTWDFCIDVSKFHSPLSSQGGDRRFRDGLSPTKLRLFAWLDTTKEGGGFCVQ